MNEHVDLPPPFYMWQWMRGPQWEPIPDGWDKPARPKPLGGRKRSVGEARPGATARAKARSKRRRAR